MLLKKVLKFFTRFSFWQLKRNCKNIEKVQVKRWKVIRKNIGDSRRLEDCPLTDFEDYRERIAKGLWSDTCPLTGHKVIAWLKTSGTTATPKVYPMTKVFQKELQRLGGPFLYSVLSQREHFLESNLMFISSPREKVLDNGLPYCPISYINYITRPFFIRWRSVVKDEDLRDANTFFNDLPVRALASELDTIMAIMPEVIVRFFTDIKTQFEKYLARVDEFDVSPKRKVHLEKLRGKDFNISELWPDLKTIFCWKTSICQLQLPELEKLLDPNVKIIDAFYTTTEASFTTPIDANRLGGPLDPSGHVVEFLPTDKEPTKENLLKPWQLEVGKNYEVVVTTSMGFVRYRLFDIVECTGFFEKSPWLIFKQKSVGQISLGHTRFSEEHLMKGLNQAQYPLQPGDFFAPREDGKGLVFYSDTIKNTQIDSLNQYMGKVSPQFLEDIEHNYLFAISKEKVPLHLEVKRLPQQKQKLLQHSPPLG